MSVVCVIPAKNEEAHIQETLKTIKHQVDRIIVVDDHSSDNTRIKAMPYADVITSSERLSEYKVGTSHIARVINDGIKEAIKYNPDHILILGADTLVPEGYVKTIIKRIENTDIVIASGRIEGELKTATPRGSGRIIKTSFFKKLGYKYPEYYAFDTYPILYALKLGYRTKVYNDLIMKVQRKTMGRWNFVNFGRGMKWLGYTIVFMLFRSVLIFTQTKSLKNALDLIKGYILEKNRCDLAKWFEDYQKRLIIGKIKRIIR
ncbi:MAG: glycosyltransferase family A protein, partial [Candidatus Bathyarchaeia archaeon]